MNNPRDNFSPFWLETTTPGGTQSGPPGWSVNRPDQSIPPDWDWSKASIPPAPWFPSASTNNPSWQGNTAAIEPTEPPSGGVLGSLRPPAQPPR